MRAYIKKNFKITNKTLKSVDIQCLFKVLKKFSKLKIIKINKEENRTTKILIKQ